MENKGEQIFHDPTRRRWRYLKWIFIFGFFLYAFGLVITVLSIYYHPILPRERIVNNFSFVKEEISSVADFFGNAAFFEAKAVGAPSGSGRKFDLSQKTCPSPNENHRTSVFAYQADWDENSLASLEKNLDSIDYLVLDWHETDFENFEFVPNRQDNQTRIRENIKSRKPALPLFVTIDNFDSEAGIWKGDLFRRELKEKKQRAQFIKKLDQFVRSNEFSGVNLDLRDIPSENKEEFLSFLDEVHEYFHPLGIQVAQTMNLNGMPEIAPELLLFSDFLIVNAFDEHNAYATEAGPLASEKWFKKRISEMFSKLPPEKIVLTLGNFGYHWKDGDPAGKQISFPETMYLAEKTDQKINFDQSSLNPFFSYPDEAGKNNSVWFLDAATFFNQISQIRCQPLFGIGIWRLGSEDPSLWQIARAARQNNLGKTQFVSSIDMSHLITNEGEGEVLKVVKAPAQGRRDIVFDGAKGKITDEQYEKFPLPYVVARIGTKNKKQIALTFDDGPDEKYTPQVLDILKNSDAKATFFLIGSKIMKYPGIAERILREGGEVGNHTFTHPNTTYLGEKNLEIELSAFQRALESVSGKHTVLFRPPYGEDVEPEKTEELKSILTTSRLGYLTVAMHIDPRDWQTSDAEMIVQKTIEAAEAGKGNIVLLHDGGGDRNLTLEALPGIIAELKNRGFEFVTVSELIGEEKSAVLPEVDESQKNITAVNKANFTFFSGLITFLKWLFAFGIAIGIFRSVFVTTLALGQWRSRKKKRESEIDRYFEPFVSVLVPAYNERKVVGRTLDSILGSTYQKLEVIAIDDGSTDGTGLFLKKRYKNNPKVKVFSQKNSGKAGALNLGFEKSEAEIVIALDADTLFEPDTISRLVKNFRDPKVGAVAGNTKVGNQINFMTRCQAIEYVSSQNLDRRAFHFLNCISVVPGAVGAWRKKVIVAAGGYSRDTLAEDADLTFSVIRQGYRVVYEDRAVAFTEAPDSIRSFLKQRFRWMYGSLQTIWKHRDIAFRPKQKALGFVVFPNVLIFQIFFPFISPVLDLYLAFALVWAGWQSFNHPTFEYSGFHGFQNIFYFYALFFLLELFSTAVALLLEKNEKKSLIFWSIAQRFLYRQLMYYIAIKTVFSALKGSAVGWNKLERKNTVFLDSAIPLQRTAEESV